MKNSNLFVKNKHLITRLNRIEGQIRGIKNMIEENRECLDIMHQILSASAALRSIWELIAAFHLQNCVENIEDKEERNKNINELISHIKELK